MTSKRPTPLKDEPVAPLDELQDLLVKNIAATNALNKTISGSTNTQPVSPETVATAARNAVKELLEQRQRKFEQEEQEASARQAHAAGVLRQTCGGLCRRAAKMHNRMRHLQGCRGSCQAAGSPQPRDRSQTGCPYRYAGSSGGKREKNSVSAPSQAVQGRVRLPVQRYTVILHASGVPFPLRSAARVDMPVPYLADYRCDCLFYRTRQCGVAEGSTELPVISVV